MLQSVSVRPQVLAPTAPAAAPAASGPASSDPSDIVTLQLLHTNDIHSHVENMACLSELIKQQTAKFPSSTIVVDAGDQVHGTAAGDLQAGKPMIRILNQIGYNAMTVGNHNFQWGVTALKQWMRQSHQPIVLANVVQSNGKPLPNSVPYRIEDVGGIKVGVLGLLTSDTSTEQRAEKIEGVKFLKEQDVLNQYLPQMKAQGAQVVTLLTHCGKDGDEALAAANPDKQLYFIGGHSHDLIGDPDRVGQSAVVQAGCYDSYLGVLQLDYDRKKNQVVAVRHFNIPVDPKGPRDAAVETIARAATKKANDEMKQVVGTLQQPLTRDGQHDSPLGNVVADAMRTAAGAEIALTNSDGLRNDLAAGPVHLYDLYSVMPFGGELKVGNLSGADIKAALEHSVDQRPTPDTWHTPFLQVSGLQMAYDDSRPEGDRITDLKVNGQPIDPNKSYKVALEDFLTAGKLGYQTLTDGKFADTGLTVFDALQQYIESNANGGPAVETGRIRDNTPKS